MALICTSPPLVEPVSLGELKDMLRIDQGDTSQDNLLMGLNTAARSWCETITQRRFVQQTWSLYLDFFPGYIDMKLAGQKVSSPFVSGSNAVLVGIRYAIVLPYPPVQNFVSFTYINASGDVTDMMNGQPNTPADWNFVLDTASQPARIMPLFGQMWPVAMVIANALKLQYTVGYASPVAVSTTSGSNVLGTATFTSANVGQPISIPGAGRNFTSLNTIIQSVSGSVATLGDTPTTTGTATALLVDNGNPAHWELLKTAVKVLVNAWFVNRLPSFDAAARDAVTALLVPVMDKRL
jgi:hypothetical protein